MHQVVIWVRRNRLIVGSGLLALSVLFSYELAFGFSQNSPAGSPRAPEWRPVGLQGTLVHFLAPGHRAAAPAFAAAHGGIYRRDSNGQWVRVLASGDVWAVALSSDDRTVIAGDNDGTVHISHDAGNHWRSVLVAPQGVYSVAMVPGHPRSILAGAGGGIYLSRDEGLHWQRRHTLPHSAGAAFAWQPGSRRVVVAGAVAGDVGGSVDVLISRDAGMTWHVFGRNLQSYGGIMSLLAASNAQLYAGTMGNATWKASLQTRSWSKVGDGMPASNDHVAGIAGVPGRPQTLYVGTLSFGVFRTVDGGRHWTAISDGLSEASSAKIVLSIVYVPTHHALLAGTADGVYELGPI